MWWVMGWCGVQNKMQVAISRLCICHRAFVRGSARLLRHWRGWWRNEECVHVSNMGNIWGFLCTAQQFLPFMEITCWSQLPMVFPDQSPLRQPEYWSTTPSKQNRWGLHRPLACLRAGHIPLSKVADNQLDTTVDPTWRSGILASAVSQRCSNEAVLTRSPPIRASACKALLLGRRHYISITTTTTARPPDLKWASYFCFSVQFAAALLYCRNLAHLCFRLVMPLKLPRGMQTLGSHPTVGIYQNALKESSQHVKNTWGNPRKTDSVSHR